MVFGFLNWPLSSLSMPPPPVSVNGFVMVPEDFDYSRAFGLASSQRKIHKTHEQRVHLIVLCIYIANS